ncbi:MAG: hypothetical protein D6707_11290 [Bacteroidetes bacterium]|nr:MAG: hypothetical protein D6707_11290 [Bacteroidota bacterium]
MSTLKEKILNSQYTEQDIHKLSKKYEEKLKTEGIKNGNLPLIRDFAHLLAYYKHDLDSAILLLEKALTQQRATREELAKCKLDLGDYLLMSGNVWDAALYYAQVDKEFKFDYLGEIAKFKTAKIHFYTGSFKLAKAMLDVLKGSTSKLIANDALQLSLLISDNSTVDTTTQPLKMYARAELLLTQNKLDEAITVLDSITQLFPYHSLTDEIYFIKYKAAVKRRNYREAEEYLNKIITEFPDDILTDDALFTLAELYENQLNNPEKAKETYKKLIFEHPDSVFAIEARKRYRMLRGDKLNEDDEI